MSLKNLRKAALTILVAATTAMPVMAQNQPGGQGGFQGQGGYQGQGGGFQGQGGGRGFDPAQMRQTMSDRYKEALGSSDEEWAVIGPKIDKIQQLQADAGGGIAGAIGLFMRGFGGRMGRGGGLGGGRGFANPFGSDSVVQKKIQSLQDAIDNKDMPDTEIKIRLNAVREERDKVRVELDKARKELIELLTSRQEATLFQMGILE
ncbi:MAG TPA: hypothetical protein VHD56_19960 [Tepidisphaeraceae bacterium]|nr:hypothetical protein [Tepidisphaeraceae bacterium]